MLFPAIYLHCSITALLLMRRRRRRRRRKQKDQSDNNEKYFLLGKTQQAGRRPAAEEGQILIHNGCEASLLLFMHNILHLCTVYPPDV